MASAKKPEKKPPIGPNAAKAAERREQVRQHVIASKAQQAKRDVENAKAKEKREAEKAEKA